MLATSTRKVPGFKETRKKSRKQDTRSHSPHNNGDAQIHLTNKRATTLGDFKYYHIHGDFSRNASGSRIGFIIDAKRMERHINDLISKFNGRQFNALYEINECSEISQTLSPEQWAILREVKEVKLNGESINEALESKRFLQAKFLPHYKLGKIRKDGMAVQKRICTLIDAEFSDENTCKKLKKLVTAIAETYDGITFKGARHMRKNGEPAYTHPLETFELAVKLGMRNVVILAALLGHDLLEDIKELPKNAKAGQKEWPELSYKGVEQLYRSCGFSSPKQIKQIWLLICDLTKPEVTEKGRRMTEANSQKIAFDQLTSIEALFIKVCDCTHNMITQDVFLSRPDKLDDHIHEAEELRNIFIGHLSKYVYQLRSKSTKEVNADEMYNASLALIDVFEQQIERTKGLSNTYMANSYSRAAA